MNIQASRTPRGVRGLKFKKYINYVLAARRTPRGVRGLKSRLIKVKIVIVMSHPSRGAWIEIIDTPCGPDLILSHPSRGAWIEIG